MIKFQVSFIFLIFRYFREISFSCLLKLLALRKFGLDKKIHDQVSFYCKNLFGVLNKISNTYYVCCRLATFIQFIIDKAPWHHCCWGLSTVLYLLSVKCFLLNIILNLKIKTTFKIYQFLLNKNLCNSKISNLVQL